ncbi:MAG: PAS domain-containing protein [Pacificimonas sp.]
MSIVDLDGWEIVDTIRDALLILDEELVVEFASRSFYSTFNVDAEETVGRPLSQLGNGQWDIPALGDLLHKALAEEDPIESWELEWEFPRLGRRIMRLKARKTVKAGNGSRRILLAIEDITARAEAEAEAERQQRLAQGIVETIREPLLVLDMDLTILSASRAFYMNFGVTAEKTIGQPLARLGNGQWDIPDLLHMLTRVVPERESVEEFEVVHDFPVLGPRHMLLNARKIYRLGNNTKTLLLAIEDITEMRILDAERRAALARAEDLLVEINHRTMNSLAVIGSVISLEARNMTEPECKAAFQRMHDRVQAVAELYRSISKASALESVPANEYLDMIAHSVAASLGGRDGRVVEIETDIVAVPLSTKTAVPLGLILNELMTNAFKYAFPDRRTGRISVSLQPVEGEAANVLQLTVADDGRGIDPKARVDSGIGGRLVDAFAADLGGRIERETSGVGTSVSLVMTNE